MEKIVELKAEAYDALAKLEYLQNELSKCQDLLKDLNEQIKTEFEASKVESPEVEVVN